MTWADKTRRGISEWVSTPSAPGELSWADRLRNWLNGVSEYIIKHLLLVISPPALLIKLTYIQWVRDNPNSTQEAKSFADALSASSEESRSFYEMVLAILGVLPGILSVGKPQANLTEYAQEHIIKSARLDPQSVITAWRRDKAANAKWLDDLKDQGWSDERIDALKFITEVIPNAADIVRFALREVYSPEIAEQYGQFQDIPTAAYPDAARAGLSEDMFRKYWAAHWALPSASDGFELLHRGILTEEQLKGLLKANDIMPYWRDQLIKLSWNIPTRVDVRRFWDMRTIDEARLREIYTGLGYHGRDLDDYVLWTKIYTDFPDLLARYKNGWITIEDVKVELVAMGMGAARAETLIQEKIKKAAPERVAAEKNLTKAEIIKGVKLAVITRAEGIELLQDMGYGPEEATYIMAINLEASTGSPHNYADFKDITQQYRLATGKEGKPMTEEIKKLGSEVVRLSAEVESINRSIKEEQGTLVETEGLPQEATARLKELQTALYKAQAELTRVQVNYRGKVAEWRHAA